MKTPIAQTFSRGLVLLALITISPGTFADDSSIAATLWQWRQHVLSSGNLGGVELESESYRTLVAMGPACLPEVFKAYRDETDGHVLYYYGILIRRIAHFDFFRFSNSTVQVGDQEYADNGEKPFLSMEIGRGTPSASATAALMRDKLVAWWDQRAAFLQRRETHAVVRAITGRTEQEYQQLDKRAARELSKQAVYGIYNLPDYVNVIAEDNNPVIFSEWLRISNHPAFQTLELTADLAANMRTVNEKYPTTASKLGVICEWWSQNSVSYAALEDLHRAMDQRVKAACR